MTITITDSALLAQVRAIESCTELRDAEGNLVGYVEPAPHTPLLRFVEKPFTGE